MVSAGFPADGGPAFRPRRASTVDVLLAFCLCLSACGGGGGGPGEDRAPPEVRIVISPASATMVPGATRQFTATVLHADNPGVTWSVDGVNNGDATVGRISISGGYTAPDIVPTPDTVTVRARSRQDPSKTASAAVKILTICSAGDAAEPSGGNASSAADFVNAGRAFTAEGGPGPKPAAHHRIPVQVESFDCSSMEPGDMLTLAAGTRGPLTVRNCRGAADNPIIIRNDPEGTGPTIVTRADGPEGAFVFNCHDCIGVAIDGSYKWQGAPADTTYGIKVTMAGGGAPSAFLKIGGLSSFVTIRNVEIDGAWPALANNGIGISVNDHSVKRVDYPGLWREGILIEDTYVHNVEGEGMYVGPNYQDGDLPLRDIEIRRNRVEDTGWDGINTKSMWAGDNSIHHNRVRRAGGNAATSDDSSEYSGIMNNAGTVKIYNNWVETTGQHGIQAWVHRGPAESDEKGPFEAEIWNNVIVDAGGSWQPFMSNSYGISVGAQAGCEKPLPYVYNNTIVNSRQSGIRLAGNVGAGFVRDNIIAGAGNAPGVIAPGFVELVNNFVGSVTLMEFADPTRMDFHLGVTSPAWNQGGDEFPATDFDDEIRPKDGAPDPGAFEGNSSSAATRTNAERQ